MDKIYEVYINIINEKTVQKIAKDGYKSANRATMGLALKRWSKNVMI